MNAAYDQVIAAAENDRRDLFLKASTRLGTAIQNVEKDFWVRATYYPALIAAADPAQSRASAHTDYGTLTILYLIHDILARDRIGEGRRCFDPHSPG